MLEAATAYLANRLASVTSVPITYSRSDEFGATSETIQATRGTTSYESTEADGTIHRITGRDYLIARNLFGTFTEPQENDEITDGPEVYVVHAMDGDKPFRYCDTGKNQMRIHTKLLRTTDGD
jgi:hypothetical protein